MSFSFFKSKIQNFNSFLRVIGALGVLVKIRPTAALLVPLCTAVCLSSAAANSSGWTHVQDADALLNAPVQSALSKRKIYRKAGHQLEAVADFKVEARVLSAASYRKGREARISPVDLALGWSKMASDHFLSQIEVTQSGRFASMRYDPTAKIQQVDIVHNSSNMHMIPSSSAVKRQLHAIKKGQVVRIEGYLVNIRHQDGWRWLTSTSRTDVGNGACEILLVRSVTVVG